MNACVRKKHDPLCNRPTKTGEAQNGLVTGHIHLKRKTQAWERSGQHIKKKNYRLAFKNESVHLIYIKIDWAEYRALRYPELKT